MVGGKVEADGEGEGVEVEFARGQQCDRRTGDCAADGDVALVAGVALLLLEGDALVWGEDVGWCVWGRHYGCGHA